MYKQQRESRVDSLVAFRKGFGLPTKNSSTFSFLISSSLFLFLIFSGYVVGKCRPYGASATFFYHMVTKMPPLRGCCNAFSFFSLMRLVKNEKVVAKVLELQAKNSSTFSFLISYSLILIPYFAVSLLLSFVLLANISRRYRRQPQIFSTRNSLTL
jgi:hypothetical protein